MCRRFLRLWAWENSRPIRKPTPLTNIVKAGLINVPKGEDEVQAAMDEASLPRASPHREADRAISLMIGNVATLVGLLGTIGGLIQCFAGSRRRRRF